MDVAGTHDGLVVRKGVEFEKGISKKWKWKWRWKWKSECMYLRDAGPELYSARPWSWSVSAGGSFMVWCCGAGLMNEVNDT